MAPAGPVTQLLARISSGDSDALDQLFPLVYDQLRRAAEQALRADPGVGNAVFGICTSQVETLVNRALRDLLDARIGISPITLRGHGDITGPNSIRTGVWDGTLFGSSFSGNFDASR